MKKASKGALIVLGVIGIFSSLIYLFRSEKIKNKIGEIIKKIKKQS